MSKRIKIASLAFALFLLGGGCGAPTAPSANVETNPPAASANAVTIEEYAFKPEKLTVKKGATVVWTNKDVARHTVTGETNGPASQLFGQNETYSYTFDAAGTFSYKCEPHPYMKGMVEVTE